MCFIAGFKKAKKGEIIFLYDKDYPRVYFLKKGALKIVFTDNNGNEAIQDILQKGDLFGGLPASGGNGNEEYAVALSNDVVICSFLLSDFEKLMLRKPELALKYTKWAGLRFKRIRNSYRNLIFKDTRTRLLIFLKDWMEREGKQEGEKVVIQNYLTQNDLAQVICASRQTVAGLLSELEAEGILLYSRKEIVVFNCQKIKKWAQV